MPIAIKDSTIDITSEKLTKELAKEFTKYLKGGEFVFLYGEMGVGKTTFVKYFINEYQKINNLTQTEITSPTFSLLNEYQVKGIRIKHYDLFRINRKEDINNLDIFEKDNKLITLIEWPQLIAEKKNIKFITLTFNYLNQLNGETFDYVFYIAGVDIHFNDRLGKLKVSDEGIRKRDEIVTENFFSKNVPLCGVLGGGYNKDFEKLVELHSFLHQSCAKLI